MKQGDTSVHGDDLPAPSASGTLEKKPFAHLLLYAHERRLTGTIDLAGPDGDARIVFAEGFPVKAAAVGDTLVARLEAIFGLGPETAFAYFHEVDGLVDEEPAHVEPLPLIWRGIVKATPWPHVRAALARVAGARVKLSPTFDPIELGLGAIELAIVDRLRVGPVDLEALLTTGLLALAEAERLLYFLIITKRVDVIARSPSEQPPSRSESPPAVLFPSAYPPPRYTSDSGPPPSVVPSRIDAARAHFARISSPPPSSRGSGMRPATVANASELLLALEARRAAIVDRALKIDHETAFQMLGVGPEASSHDIQAAFFALAKMWHPDTLPPGLANMKEKCAHIFSRISEAHQRIGDPDRRALYLRELDSANEAEEQEVVRGALEAVHCFQAANVHLKRGNVVEAETECRKALELDPEPTDYTALFLWLQALKEANHAPFKTVGFIDQLAALLTKNPSCERAFFYRGMLYKRLGEHPYALSDFKKVYGLNPDNIDAQREIRSYNTRGVKSIAPGRRSMSPPSESGRPGQDNSLLGKLFKK